MQFSHEKHYLCTRFFKFMRKTKKIKNSFYLIGTEVLKFLLKAVVLRPLIINKIETNEIT